MNTKYTQTTALLRLIVYKLTVMRFPLFIASYLALLAKHSARLTAMHCGRRNRSKSYFQSPIRIRTAELLARFRLAHCVSNLHFVGTGRLDGSET